MRRREMPRQAAAVPSNKVSPSPMATDPSFVEYVCEQAGLEHRLTHRKMFGEYALYLEGRVVAFVCDNQVFIKPTAAGERLAPQAARLPPYPGAKLYLRLADELDDRDLLRRILVATANELPLPKPGTKAKARPAAARGRG